MRRNIFVLSVFLLSFLGASCATFSQDNKKTEDSFNGQLETARQYIIKEEYSKAMAILQNLRRTHPEQPLVELNMGVACMGMLDFTCAEQAFKKATQLDKKNAAAKLNYGYVLIVQKRYKEARDIFTEIEKDKKFPWMERVLVNHGLAWMEEGDCHKALKKFQDALTWDPTFISAYYNMGICQMRLKRYNEAVYAFKRAMDFCSQCTEAAVELSKAYAYSGQKDKAIAQLQSMLQKNLPKQDMALIQKTLQELQK